MISRLKGSSGKKDKTESEEATWDANNEENRWESLRRFFSILVLK